MMGSAPGCSGGDTSTFDGGEPDEGLGEAGPVDAQFVQEAGDDGGTCAPASVANFTPTNKKPATPNKAACTAPQLDAYYTACLEQPLDAAKCNTFKQANAACGTCLDTSETDATLGPVVWYNSRQYYTVNIPGCIALKFNDTTPQGCGEAYQAVLECRRASCAECLVGSSANFPRFSDCQKTAGTTTCLSYYKAESDACKTLSTGTPADVCVPPAGSTAKDAFLRIAPIFCGPPGDGG